MKKSLLLTLLFSVFCTSSCLFAQAVQYKRNGECYLLIGHDNALYRGVYRLNNPSGEGDGNPVGQKLFDPQASYGIYVDLDRQVFTFSQNTEPTYSYNSGWTLKRLLKAPGGIGLWGAHCDTRKAYHVPTENKTYNEAGKPIYTTVGPMGNGEDPTSWDPVNVCWNWSGVVKPVIKEAKRWYFKKIAHYCCSPDCSITNGLNDGYWCYFVDVDAQGYGIVPNGAWWQSRDPDPPGRPGNVFYWDRSERKHTFYDLNYWKKSFGVWSASNNVISKLYRAKVGTIYDEIVKRSQISACLNYCCVNGSKANSFEAQPKFVSLAMSPFGRTYLYSRTQTSTTDGKIEMGGIEVSPTSPNVIGFINDLSTQWVGVSTKSKSEDYIYLLGTRTIKSWLDDYNIKVPSLAITSVAVSDQWWLDGGIIYAYDKAEGAAYQFVRDDKSGTGKCKSRPTKISLGSNIDAIGADGDGNLYFTKTNMMPASTAGLTWSHAYRYAVTSNYSGRIYGYVYYKQQVYKTAYCQEFGASSYYQLGTQINIGNNEYRRYFSISTTDFGSLPSESTNITAIRGKPLVWSGGFEAVGTKVSDPKLTQLGVINVARPPTMVTPNSQLALVDIVGIEDSNPAFKFATDEVKQGMYTFRIENAPYWSGRNNIAVPGKTEWEGDRNNNGTEGGFVSSIMNTSASVNTSPQVLYTWKIYKIQDAFGNVPADASKPVRESATPTSSPRTDYYFRSGTYQIMCSAKFKYYDYNSLPFGSTVNDINDAIRPKSADGTAMLTALAAPLNPAINSGNFPGLQPIPPNTACTILKVNRQSPPPAGKTVDIQLLSGSTWKDPSLNGTVKYHVVNEKQSYNWRLKGDPSDPPGSYLHNLYNLPNITNSNMIPGSLMWVDSMPVQYEWTLNLTLPDGSSYPAQEVSKNSYSQSDVAIALKQDFPTDPVMGELTCKAFRKWIYEENIYSDDGEYIKTEFVEGKVEYNGSVKVLVIDKTPPKIVQINGISFDGSNPLNPIYLGETGQPVINSTLSYNTFTNPTEFTVLVEDNNIYANMNNLAEVAPSARLHDRGVNQSATMFFERTSAKTIFPAIGFVPGGTNNSDTCYYSSPGVTILADGLVKDGVYMIKREPIKWKTGDISSYVKYTFRVSDWKHLQPGTDSDLLQSPTRWPTDFANNCSSYENSGALGVKHQGYAVMFQAIDSSGHKTLRTHIGNVWIKDSLAPIVSATVRDYAGTFEEQQPYGLNSFFKSGKISYGLLSTASNWYVASNFKYAGMTSLLGIPSAIGESADKNLVYSSHPPLIQEGTEVFIKTVASDNISVPNQADTGIPSAKVTGPAGLYMREGAKQLGGGSSGITSIKDKELRLMLQESGVYKVILTAEDNAKDFSGKSAPNKRTVEFGIIVAPSSMNIRAIDKLNTQF